jgi:hypothetical protein
MDAISRMHSSACRTCSSPQPAKTHRRLHYTAETVTPNRPSRAVTRTPEPEHCVDRAAGAPISVDNWPTGCLEQHLSATSKLPRRPPAPSQPP